MCCCLCGLLISALVALIVLLIMNGIIKLY
ncbi:hypothetical protein CYL21_0512 [Plasmodium falciparum NF54]|uniref:Uncharacterized protein n=2 Tax=Plasmodium falciparum TaxID=5833 RepID=Q8II34_PLAF7|nr:conserved Plasmodium protein, unknown function [Plasmodium falciparum 3D7]KAF4331014.1 hypothetical protein CYL21_0512 [Plasmodium falciparum NF54]PKC48911.1 hypothetical protein CK202_0854 [Plasmodium falciparum NF54]CZT98992.1 conserved Plasmodium protein, unknown function [Plasmodium falciparum 3D7]|eukprot:XP_001348011.2 conserved Plasmodium protein, unknown function [Plasmodium falciparum 3D7]